MKLLSYLTFSLIFVVCVWHFLNRLNVDKIELDALKDGVYTLISMMFLLGNYIRYYMDKDK